MPSHHHYPLIPLLKWIKYFVLYRHLNMINHLSISFTSNYGLLYCNVGRCTMIITPTSIESLCSMNKWNIFFIHETLFIKRFSIWKKYRYLQLNLKLYEVKNHVLIHNAYFTTYRLKRIDIKYAKASGSELPILY